MVIVLFWINFDRYGGKNYMKKRIIATLLIIMLMLAVVMVSACGSDDPDPQPPAQAGQQPADDTPADGASEEDTPADPPEQPTEPEETLQAGGPMRRGTWDGNIFTSEYLGLRFAKPEGWFIATDEEIAELTGIGMEFFADDVDIDALMELAAVTTVYDMMATGIEGVSVSILYEQLIFPATRLTAREYIEVMAEMVVSVGMDVDLDFPETTRIGYFDWYSFRSVMDVFGMNIYGHYFINIHEGFARTIMINYADFTNTPEEILGLFFGLNDPTPPPLPAQPLPETVPAELPAVDASQLVGVWYWDGEPYYIFNADGTGILDVGYDNLEIIWEVVGAVLRFCYTPDNCGSLDACSAPEEWQIEFDGEDNMTLSSITMPGWVFDYVRG
jgi:hypothetical protein